MKRQPNLRNIKPNFLGNIQNIWVGRKYQTVQAAIDSISDASESKPYVVRIPPGVYVENIILQPWVFLNGTGRKTVQIKSTTGNVVTLATNSGLSNLSLETTFVTGKTIVAESLSNGSIWIENCDLDADFDLYYLTNCTSLVSYLQNVGGATSFDGIASQNSNANCTFHVFNPQFELRGSVYTTWGLCSISQALCNVYGGRFYGNGSFGSQIKRGVVAGIGSVVNLYGLQIDITNTSGSGDVLGVYSSAGTVNIFGGSIATDADGGTPLDISQAGIGIINAFGTAYDRNQMAGTVGGAELQGSTTWNPGNLVDGAGETSSAITVTGAIFGNPVVVAAPYDLQGIVAHAYVSATDTVKIRIQNETGGAIDLANGTWKVRVLN